MQEEPPTDRFAADPDMRNTQQRPGKRWKAPVLVAALALTLALLAAYLWWPSAPVGPVPGPVSSTVTGPQAEASAPAPVAVAPAGPQASEPAAPEAAASGVVLPALNESDLVFARWLENAFGREGLAQLRINDFARSFVATVDNLGREHASALRWPVNPAPGRFATISHDGRTVIDPDNMLRYAAFVLLLESADPARLVDIYRTAYPLLQQAYGELGFPGQSFHRRLLAVIDHLLAAPEPEGEIEVVPVEVRGPLSLSQPWRHIAFADPALEQLSAGQKLMVRLGVVNERRLKQVLIRVRAALTAPAAPR